MAALRRGIAHYQGGSANTSPDDAAFIADRAAKYNQGQGVTPVTPATPAPGASGGFGQLMSGVGQLLPGLVPGMKADPDAASAQFSAARDNPASSPATAGIGQFMDYLVRSTRAQEAARGPSLKDWLTNTFMGDTASTKVLQDRAQAAQDLKDPVIQHGLMTNSGLLARAEQDPVKFAAVAKDPDFRADLERAAGTYKEAADHPKIASAEVPKTANDALTHDTTVAGAHAAANPHYYTRDEFIKATDGMTSKAFDAIFGARLAHVPTPAEKASSEYFDRLHGQLAAADTNIANMKAEDAALAKEGKPAKHGGYVYWGKNALDQAQEDRDKVLKTITDALAAQAGIYQKQWPAGGGG